MRRIAGGWQQQRTAFPGHAGEAFERVEQKLPQGTNRV
jgi:hypothetical protein